MTQEDKELLLKDLCARVPYHPKGHVVNACNGSMCDEWLTCATFPMFTNIINNCRLYLRPMSSMTEEEKRELQSFYPGSFGCQWLDTEKGTIDIFECSSTITLYLYDSQGIVDWLNKKMFDYRGLIEMGLALEASKDMYK